MLVVMGVTPAWASITPGPGAMSVPGDDGPTQRGGYDPGPSAYVDDLGIWAEDDPTQRAVAGECAQLCDGEHPAGFGFVKTPGDALESGDVAHHVDMGLLPADRRSVRALQIVAGQIF